MLSYPYLMEMREKFSQQSKHESRDLQEITGCLEREEAAKVSMETWEEMSEREMKKPFRRHASSSSPKNPKTATCIVLSAFYSKLVIVTCLAFLTAEVMTKNVTLHFYEAFFVYLYGVSILFLLYIFCYLLQECNRKKTRHGKKKVADKAQLSLLKKWSRTSKEEQNLSESDSPFQTKVVPPSDPSIGRPEKHKTSAADDDTRSFCLRIGAIAFGLGTMISCGLDCGIFFETPWDSPCHNILRAVNPLLQALFTFMQMYLVFVNAKLNIHKFKIVARFGLMHIVATNICVWIRTVARLWLKDVLHHYAEHGAVPTEDQLVLGSFANATLSHNASCGHVNIMGSVVDEATPYLYPIIVEYSLICAAVLYVMWRHVEPETFRVHPSVGSPKRSKVNCVGSSRGLFAGLFLLVAAVICLIAFFVLSRRNELHLLASCLAEGSHAGLLLFALVAIPVGLARVQHLRFVAIRRADFLNDLLLAVSGFGILLYSCFCVIAASVPLIRNEFRLSDLLLLVTHVLAILQVVLQALFIKDASRRRSHLLEHDCSKPGRQVVSFLLMINVALWIFYTLEMQKVEAHPVQIDFYGSLPWNLILRFCLPLSILHRFHGATMLAEVWRNTYRPIEP